MKLILYILFFSPILLFSQVATFEADTSQIQFEKENEPDIYKEILKSEWKINGQLLKYSSNPIEVKIDNIIDTIYFRKNNEFSWDTIICNISKPNKFNFIYNECCGTFYVEELNTEQFIKLKLSNSKEQESYSVRIEDMSSSINSDLNEINFTTLTLKKDSPMSVKIYEIKIFENQNMKFKFKYLPINNDTNEFIINIKDKIIKLK